MITTTDLYKKICEMLRDEFGKPVYSKNTLEGFVPECFYVELVSPSESYAGSMLKAENLSVRITFIPETEKCFERNLEVKNALQELFNKEITVQDGFEVPIIEQSFEFTTNNALEMLIQLQTVQMVDEPDGALMGEIVID